MAYGATLKKLFTKNPLCGGIERAQSGLKLDYLPLKLTNQKEGTASGIEAFADHRLDYLTKTGRDITVTLRKLRPRRCSTPSTCSCRKDKHRSCRFQRNNRCR